MKSFFEINILYNQKIMPKIILVVILIKKTLTKKLFIAEILNTNHGG